MLHKLQQGIDIKSMCPYYMYTRTTYLNLDTTQNRIYCKSI